MCGPVDVEVRNKLELVIKLFFVQMIKSCALNLGVGDKKWTQTILQEKISETKTEE